MTALQIDLEFQSLLPALTDEESAALESSIEAEGCRDALIAWGDTLVDGHNRYEICNRRGFEYTVRQMDFDSREDVIIWICANQNARRNITLEQKAYLLGKRYEAEKKKQAGNPTGRNQYTEECAQSGHITGPNRTAKRIAAELDIGSNTVRRAADFSRAVDTLAADSPTIKRKILSGEVKQARTAIVEIAAKPESERREAVEKMERGEIVEVKAKAEKEKAERPMPETKVCRNCGRELPTDKFSISNGKVSADCLQCIAMTHASGKREDAREHMATLVGIVDDMYDDTVPDYTLDDILDEIRRGADALQRLIHNALQQHADLIDTAEARAQYDDLISDISGAIYNLRRS
jgi:hypothetical protein